MIGRERAEAGREARAAEVRELLGMDLHREARARGRRRTPARPAAGPKAMPSQKASTASTRPSACGGAQRRDADPVDVGVAASMPAGRRGRRGRSCATRSGRSGADLAGDAQHAELGLAVEAVARLDLQGGDALGDQRVDARQSGVASSALEAGRAGRAHGRGDAAAGAGDLLVARALQPQLELARPVAAEDDVACGSRSAPASPAGRRGRGRGASGRSGARGGPTAAMRPSRDGDARRRAIRP